MRSVVVLGGYGNFGRRIVEALAHEADLRVFIAGRDLPKAERLAREIRGNTQPLVLDSQAEHLASVLRNVDAHLVVHTAGPFQGQSYAVPRACIQARCHYIDLADARAFVCGIQELDEQAKKADVLVVSGASSLPALSSAVVDDLAREFSTIESIEHSITSGARPPGIATMQGVLAYAGKPFMRWHDGRWIRAYGWQDLTLQRYPAPLGLRALANCDVPDLELFPKRYSSVRSVSFKAGMAQLSHMFGIGFAAALVRIRLLKSVVPYVPRLHSIAAARASHGSKHSAMRVHVRGLDLGLQPHARTWTLVAGSDHGPFIPCFPAIALARKIMRDALSIRGALPCMGLLSTSEILDVGRGLDIAIVPELNHEHAT